MGLLQGWGKPKAQPAEPKSHLPEAIVDEDEENPLDREAARVAYVGPGGDELLSRMEDEFVAKSGALVGRMTVAAAQEDMVELSHELETLQVRRAHLPPLHRHG